MAEQQVPDKKTVKEMDISAPRYTSYPTIPVWDNSNDEAPYVKVLDEHDPARVLSLYFHVPFCPTVCYYCGCNTSKLKDDQQVDSYVEYLLREMELVAGKFKAGRKVSHIHWGGGSPTILNEKQFSRVFAKLRQLFEVDSNSEIAIEANPMTTDDEKLELLLSLGFNRFSIGIQDFNEAVQKHIGRFQTFSRTKEFCRRIRAAGVRSLNFDLVYGLPGQSLGGLRETLDRVEELSPDRIAVYSFAFLPSLRDNQKKINPDLLPETETKFDLYLLTIQMLNAAGYKMIGIDHYARPEDELVYAQEHNRLRRNFMGYTTIADSDVLAFGATGISDVQGFYSQNLKNLDEYYAAIDAEKLPLQRQKILDRDDLLRRKVIMDILCNGKLDIPEIERQFEIDFSSHFKVELERLKPLISRGMIHHDGLTITASQLGKYFLRNIVLNFDNYLDGRKGKETKIAFSRTV